MLVEPQEAEGRDTGKMSERLLRFLAFHAKLKFILLLKYFLEICA